MDPVLLLAADGYDRAGMRCRLGWRRTGVLIVGGIIGLGDG